jgi:hypothetical protein
MAKTKSPSASIGLRAKTGRAIVVVLSGPPASPRVIKRTQLTLWDPAIPATGQPYHEVMELPWDKAQVAVKKIARRIEAVTTKALARLVKEMQADGYVISGVGVVGAGDRNLEKIGSTHIRAHAAEGVLFRRVLEVAAAANKMRSQRFDERSLEATAESELSLPAAKLKEQLAEMGRSVGSPWRTDEKAAALAAWLALDR